MTRKEIRDTLVSYFEAYNFEVKGASNGKEAIEIYNEFPHEIALIISDINMPIKNGVEFFLELKDKTNYSKPFYFITERKRCMS